MLYLGLVNYAFLHMNAVMLECMSSQTSKVGRCQPEFKAATCVLFKHHTRNIEGPDSPVPVGFL